MEENIAINLLYYYFRFMYPSKRSRVESGREEKNKKRETL